MANWTSSNIPPQTARTCVVTGTGGLGFEDALALARTGADVIIAGRNAVKGAEAVSKIRSAVPAAKVRFELLDLASLESVAAFAARLENQITSLDILINNAAVMTPPDRRETSDGFELQFGTNYLGHFALTARLLPLLKKGRNARVVTLSSIAARSGQIDFDDLNSESAYRPFPAYGQSKLACLMFAFELHRRSLAGNWGIASLAAHPGLSRTDLIPNGAGPNSAPGRFRRFMPFMFQPAAQGALPTLFAATSPAARSGAYYGPDRMSETQGYPALSKVPPQAADRDAAQRLWDVSCKLTGATFEGAELAAGLHA